MKPYKEKNYRTGGFYDRYRGQVRQPDGTYRKIVLYPDQRLSERELAKLQREADEFAHDGQAARRRQQALRPIVEHVSDYIDELKRTTKNCDHPKITRGMLDRLIELTRWERLSDITQDSMEVALKQLSASGKAANYQNDYIKKAKAFVHWCMPDRLAFDPLVKLKRGNTTRAHKPRQKRAATVDEVQALFSVLPEKIALCIGFLLLTGFRRNEAKELRFDDLRLDAAIPFIQLRPEWTKIPANNALPLHPALVKRFNAIGPVMPAVRVFHAITDPETLKKYWELAGVAYRNDRGQIDVHACRHTFSTWLDEVGVSWTTKKALTRHGAKETADGYSHARVQELYDAVRRLPSPWAGDRPRELKATGTDGKVVSAQLLSASGMGQKPEESALTGKSTWVSGRSMQP